eukprot:1943575-Amphidinium_carterae.1
MLTLGLHEAVQRNEYLQDCKETACESFAKHPSKQSVCQIGRGRKRFKIVQIVCHVAIGCGTTDFVVIFSLSVSNQGSSLTMHCLASVNCAEKFQKHTRRMGHLAYMEPFVGDTVEAKIITSNFPNFQS